LIVRDGKGQEAYIDKVKVGSHKYDHSDFNWKKEVNIGFSNDERIRFTGQIKDVFISKILKEKPKPKPTPKPKGPQCDESVLEEDFPVFCSECGFKGDRIDIKKGTDMSCLKMVPKSIHLPEGKAAKVYGMCKMAGDSLLVTGD